MSEPFDPYRKWLGIPPKDQPPHHYRLLGISPLEDDPDVIENAANRQMQHVRTYQQGRHAAHSQRILNELSAAKLCLLDPQRKQSYDKQLRRELKQKKQAAVASDTAAAPATSAMPSPAMPSPPVPGPTVPPPPASPHAVPSPLPVGMAVEPSPSPVPGLPRTSTRSAARRRRRRKSSPWPIVLGIIAVVILIGALVVALNWTPNEPRRNVSVPSRSVPQPSPQAGNRLPARTTPATSRQPPENRLQERFPVGRNSPVAPPADPVMGSLGQRPDQSPTTELVEQDRFEQMVEAARRAAAERDYRGHQTYVGQAQQEKRANDPEQVSTLELLEFERTFLTEFMTGLRRGLIGRRGAAEEHEAFGHRIVLEPYSEGIIHYTFDAESREFDPATFDVSFRELPTKEAAALADIGLRRAEESQLDINYRRIYVATFLAIDQRVAEDREEQLNLAKQLWQAAADDGSDHPALRKILEQAGVASAAVPGESDDSP